MANLVRFKQFLKDSLNRSFTDILYYSFEDDSLYVRSEVSKEVDLLSRKAGFSIEMLCISYVHGRMSENECLSQIESINV